MESIEVEHLPPEHRSSAALAARFRRFAAEECAAASEEGAGSRTYEILSETVAREPELLSMARTCRVGQPIPNLLFAAVKRVVASFPDAELAVQYRHAGTSDHPPSDLGRIFTAFAEAHRDRIVDLLQTRMVQTNEVGRCAYLMPCFGVVASEHPNTPLAVLEVGASAGLNLNWDKYRYRYSNGEEFGPSGPAVKIECDARNGMPELPTGFPKVNFRVGIDLAPVDLGDDEEYQWMQALLWPEHQDRGARLSAARDVWLQSPPAILRGDAVELLADTLKHVPQESALCVFHCHTLNQFSAEAKERFGDILQAASMERVVYHMPSEGDRVSLRRIVNGFATALLTARRQVHGRWIAFDTLAWVSPE